MSFEKAVQEAQRLGADGHGAEDHVILAAIAMKVSELEGVYEMLKHSFRNHQNRVSDLAEQANSGIAGLKQSLGQIKARMDAQSKQMQHVKYRCSNKTPQEQANAPS